METDARLRAILDQASGVDRIAAEAEGEGVEYAWCELAVLEAHSTGLISGGGSKDDQAAALDMLTEQLSLTEAALDAAGGSNAASRMSDYFAMLREAVTVLCRENGRPLP
jgi:hypothetical protein